MASYAKPDVLVSTDWVKEHIGDPGVKIVEIGVDSRAYDSGHIPGAVLLNWGTDLQDPVVRDIIGQVEFEKRVGALGISPQDTVVFYGGENNWFAAYAFWVFKYYGHADARLMNGGRTRWLTEPGQKLVDDLPGVQPASYRATGTDESVRTKLMEVLQSIGKGTINLVDARTPDEYTGRRLVATGMRESAQRGGHIPGAINAPWAAAVNSDGTFKSADELQNLYFERKNLDRSRPTVVYCSSGERASHTWFVLKYLMGLEPVTNYDGSWAEYGSMIGAPIER